MIIKDTHFIFYLFLIVFIFSYVNSLMNITEKYTGLKTKYFFNNLDKYNYKYNDAKNITFCENKDCKTKNYKATKRKTGDINGNRYKKTQ